MSVPLALSVDGASFGAALEEYFQDGTKGAGIRTANVSNGETYVHCGAGWPVGTTTGLTGNGSTLTVAAGVGAMVGFDANWLTFCAISAAADAAFAWHSWPVSPALTETDDFEFKCVEFLPLAPNTTVAFSVVELWGEADGDDVNEVILYLGATAQYVFINTSDGTLYTSASVGQVLKNTTVYCKCWHVAADKKVYLALYSDAAMTVQLGATVSATWIAGKTFSLNKFGTRTRSTATTGDGATRPIWWQPISCDNVDFKAFTAASDVADLAAVIPGAGALDFSTADLAMFLNGVRLSEAASASYFTFSYSLDDGSSYSAYKTFTELKAVGSVNIDASYGILVRVKFLGASNEQRGIVMGSIGGFTASASGGAYSPVGNSSVIGPARKVA